jgi:hypothetical protein
MVEPQKKVVEAKSGFRKGTGHGLRWGCRQLDWLSSIFPAGDVFWQLTIPSFSAVRQGRRNHGYTTSTERK